ncbi:MAG: peptidoglycan-binding protein [Firmicutes bacterium HGW-Firmicutes-14]|jgi:LysM repeat protein|nr:MAG: peptidoglycan-binding protein [Firmicutes bacterium HGW-Firmicutes-14]
MKKKLISEQPCPSGVFWIVEKGDTLFRISQQLGVPVNKLIEANPGINPRNLKIGSKICIPET